MSAEKCTDVEQLQSAIGDMGCIAADAFGQISSSNVTGLIFYLRRAAARSPNPAHLPQSPPAALATSDNVRVLVMRQPARVAGFFWCDGAALLAAGATKGQRKSESKKPRLATEAKCLNLLVGWALSNKPSQPLHSNDLRFIKSRVTPKVTHTKTGLPCEKYFCVARRVSAF